MRTPQQEAAYQQQLARNRMPPSAKKTCGWSKPKQADRVDLIRVVRVIRKLYYDNGHSLRAMVDRFGPEYGVEWVEDVIFYRLYKTEY